MTRLSVIVPTYQRRESLRRLLAALDSQRLAPDRFEAVVVVDGSTDGTLEMLRTLRPPYALVAREQRNAGRAAACNAGLAVASGEVVVLLDDDMEPLAGCLEAHDRAHRSDVSAGIIGAAPPAAAARGVAAYLAARFERHLEHLEEQGGAIRLRDMYTGNFSIPRETLRALGGYDAGFTAYGNEDLELFARMRRAGIPVRFAPDAAAVQHFAKDLASVASDQVAKGRTAVQLARKHPDLASELKLATAAEASLPVRALRETALRATDAWPGLAHLSVRIAQAVERAAPRAARHLYAPLFGYLYWVGARAALREPARADPIPATAPSGHRQ